MAEVKSEGASRIQSNDGKINIGISNNQTDMIIPVDGEDRLKISNQEIKLSQEGIPVQTSTDQESIINNTNNVFKIVSTGTATSPTTNVSAPGGGGFAIGNPSSVIIPHGLSFTPAVIAYINNGSGTNTLAPWTFLGSGGAGNAFWETTTVTTTSTSVYIDTSLLFYGAFGTSISGGGRSIKYYLLQEQAS